MVGKRPAVNGRAFCLDAMSARSGEAGEDAWQVVDRGVAVADEKNAGTCGGAFLTRAAGAHLERQQANRHDGDGAGRGEDRLRSQPGHRVIMRGRWRAAIVSTALPLATYIGHRAASTCASRRTR